MSKKKNDDFDLSVKDEVNENIDKENIKDKKDEIDDLKKEKKNSKNSMNTKKNVFTNVV